MTNEELLAPRIEVIAEDTSGDWSKGQIITVEKNRNGEHVFYLYDDECKRGLFLSFFEEYPHLFKRLQWWERRGRNDIPQYVSSIGKSIYGVVFMLHHETGSFVIKVGEDVTEAHLSNYIPATLEEYNQFIASKQ